MIMSFDRDFATFHPRRRRRSKRRMDSSSYSSGARLTLTRIRIFNSNDADVVGGCFVENRRSRGDVRDDDDDVVGWRTRDRVVGAGDASVNVA